MPRHRLAWILLAATLAVPAHAADDKVHIEYRQKLMKGVGADMGGISDILKHGLPFPDHVAVHASRLQAAAELVPGAFEKKTGDVATDAKAEIWMKPAEFAEATELFAKAAADLETAAKGGQPDAIQKAVKGLGKSCGGCHKPFRRPKEESYKNR